MIKRLVKPAIVLVSVIAVLAICCTVYLHWGDSSIGTLSDWVSSISTFLTLVVAYLAYKAAPQWIEKKKREDAYHLVREVILDDYNNLYMSWSHIRSKTVALEFSVTVISPDFSKATTIEECSSMLNKIEDVLGQSHQLEHKLDKLRKLSIIINSEISDSLIEMVDLSKGLRKSSYMAWRTASARFSSRPSENINDKAIERIREMTNSCREKFEKLEKCHSNIRNFSDDLSDYYKEVNSSQ